MSHCIVSVGCGEGRAFSCKDVELRWERSGSFCCALAMSA